MPKLNDIDPMPALLAEKNRRLEEVGTCGTALVQRMTHEFKLNRSEQDDVVQALYPVEMAFVGLGSAEFMSLYLNMVGFKFTDELPDPMIEAKPKSSQAMLGFMKELRAIGFNTADINDITDDLKKYTQVLQAFGAVNMEAQITEPKA